MGGAGYVVCMEGIRKAYKVLIGRDDSEELDVDGKMIIKQI
jgi:hypothetical protein